MWNKIFLIILAAATVAMGVLLYFPYSWLQSIDAPTNVSENFLFYSNISRMFLLVSSLLLLVAGNIVLWTTRRAWALWTAFLYFAVFTVAQSFWLENAFFHYQQEKNLSSGLISWSPFFGILMIILAAIFVFFDQYLLKRLRDKINPPAAPVDFSEERFAAVEEEI